MDDFYQFGKQQTKVLSEKNFPAFHLPNQTTQSNLWLRLDSYLNNCDTISNDKVRWNEV